MKTIMKKKVMQKIIICIDLALSFNFIVPTYSRADFGGVLMGPIIDFLAGVGDVILAGLQYFMYSSDVNANPSLTNPFNTFMVMRKADDFSTQLTENGMNVDDGQGADINLNADDFDKGLLSFLPFGLGDEDYGVPIVRYTPEKIFSNQVPALDINFINPQQWEGEGMNDRSVTQALHSTIANWYVGLRNLATVALLSVLLYVAIRMIISSAASDKSKYKQMLMDWAIAICILFFLHYIMSFVLTVTQMITEGVDSGTEIIVHVTDSKNGDFSFKTDLTGACRMQVQYSDLSARFIYLVFYLALVIYTVMFTWIYIKRAITVAFLTLMAPLVAITYPIDKISDGKAQAFSIWIKEFIFNALLQPFHLIVYTIFLGGASELAVSNPIFAILFLAFIIPSEKLLRKMFGFDKASTAGGFAAGVGGAAAFSAVRSLVSRGMKGRAGGGSGGSNNVRTKKPIEGEKPNVNDAFGNGAGAATMIAAGQGDSSDTNSNNNNNPNVNAQQNQAANDAALAKYRNEGYGQNANGEYYNPWTDEYDANYDPTKDTSYNTQLAQQQQQMSQSTQIRMNNLDKGNWAWSQNDTRGMGAYLRDGIRGTWNDSEAKLKLQDAKERVAQNRFVRTVGDGANAVRQKAVDLNQKRKDWINDNIPKPIRNTAKRTVRGVAAVGKEGLKFAGRTAVKGAGVALGMGIGGTLGMAAGIAGDDLEDVGKYTAAGLALGATGMPALGRRAVGSVSGLGANISSTYRSAAYGDTSTRLRAQTKDWKASPENRIAMEETFMEMNDGRKPTSTERRELMEAGAQYNNVGITEIKDIQKTAKLEKEIKERLMAQGNTQEEANDFARKQAEFVALKAKEYTPDKLRDEKVVNSLRNDLSKQLINGGVDKATAENQAKNITNMIKKYKGVATD